MKILPRCTVNPEIFARILFSQIVKIHICDCKTAIELDLPISVNDRVISAFHKVLFHETSHIRIRENKTLAKISEFTV